MVIKIKILYNFISRCSIEKSEIFNEIVLTCGKRSFRRSKHGNEIHRYIDFLQYYDKPFPRKKKYHVHIIFGWKPILVFVIQAFKKTKKHTGAQKF